MELCLPCTKAYLGYKRFASTALDNTIVFTSKLVVTIAIPGGRGRHMAEFDDTWQRIVALSGETFHQRRGKAFTYAVSGNSLKPSTTNRQLPRSHFGRAFARGPLDGPGQLQDLQGPSFLFAILTDPRITC